MASWIYADDPEIVALENELNALREESEKLQRRIADTRKVTRTLKVKYDGELHNNEYVCITGNCTQLGNWSADNVLPMLKDKDNIYLANVEFDIDTELFYRYLICAWNPYTDKYFTYCCETHPKPRNADKRLYLVDKFGWHEGEYQVSDTFLQQDSQKLHFYLYNAPFIYRDDTLEHAVLFVHLVPLYAAAHSNEFRREFEFMRIEVKNLTKMHRAGSINENERQQLQEDEYAVRCGAEDIILFDLTTMQLNMTLFRFDLYTDTAGAADDAAPSLYGYGYVEPDDLKQSDDTIYVRIMAPVTRETRCFMKLKYFIINPYPEHVFTFERSFQCNWNMLQHCLTIGHRGCGRTHQYAGQLMRENTIQSFQCAIASGAEMLEFDVMLSKDAKVLIAHDHVINLAINNAAKLEQQLGTRDILAFPMEEWTVSKLLERARGIDCENLKFPFDAFKAAELRDCKAYRYAAANDKLKNNQNKSKAQLLAAQQPFPLLEEALLAIDPAIGFNIDVKYVQLNACNQWESEGFEPRFERNFYVDKILEIILRYAGSRRIVFSSLDCNICAMLRFKQNLYPVLLSLKSPQSSFQYKDLRVRDFGTALVTAKNLQLSGLSLHVDILKMHTNALNCLKSLQMMCFIYLPRIDVKQYSNLKIMGVQGILYDYLDQPEAAECMQSRLFVLETPKNKTQLECIRLLELNKRNLL